MASQVPAGYQPEPGEWVGKPGQKIDGGKVAKTERWWSFRWWRGHHFTRGAGGKFAGAGGSDFRKAPASLLRGRKPAGERPARDTSRQAVARDYRAYLEGRRNKADAATNGHMLTSRAKARGVSPQKWFNGRAGVSMRDASDELRDWFRANGPNLTSSQYRLQATERRGAAAGWFGRNAA